MKLSENIEKLFAEKGHEISLSEVLESNQDKVFGFLLVIFSLPVALPLTPPGISIPFAVATIIIAFQMLLSRNKPTLPKKLLEAKMDITKNAKFVQLLLKSLRFAEKFLKPRMQWIYKSILRPKTTAIVVILAAIMMSLPFPVTNTPPGFAITMIGLGMMEEDGLFGLAGVLSFILSIILLLVLGYLVYTFGWEAVNIFKNYLKNAV